MIAVGVMPHPQHAMLGPAPTVVSSGPGISGTTTGAAPGAMMAPQQPQQQHQHLAQAQTQGLQQIPSAAAATAMQQPQANVPQIAQPTRRYVPYKVLGQGAFGTVICAKDVQTNNMVAVKKIQHIFDNALATRRVLREIKLLRALDHPNIVSCSDVLYPRNSLYTKDDGSGGSGGGGSFALAGGVQGGGGMVQVPGGSPPSTSHQEIQPNMPHPNGGGPVNPRNPIANPKLDRVYLVTEFVDTDLHRVIRSNQQLTPKHVQYFMFQAFCALDYLHRRNVLHRDMKPSNLLVKKNCELKICDFGLARVDKNPVYSQDALDPPLAVGMTEHVATRWYRAPEVILSNGMYGKAMDVWGLGCIFAELIARKPLFPGKHYLDQLTLIIDQIGAPAETEIAVFESEKARTFLRSLAHKTKKPLSAALPGADPLALDLLEQTLIFDAHKRITAAKALQHPYFKALYPSRAREIATPVAPVPPFAFDDVQNNGDSGSGGSGAVTNYQPQVTPDQWRAMVAEEVADFYRHRKAKEAAAAAAAAAAAQHVGATPSTGSVASSVVSYSPGNSASGSPHSTKASPAMPPGAAPMVAHHDPHHPQPQPGGVQHYPAQGYAVTGQPMYAAAQQGGVPGAQYYAPHPPQGGAYPYQPADEKRVPAAVPNPAYAAATAAGVVVSSASPQGQAPPPGVDSGLAAVGSGSATARGTGANSPLRVSSSPAGGVSTNHKHMEAGPFGGIGTPTRVDSPGNVDSPMRRGELGSDNSLNDSGAQTINNSTPVRSNHPPQGYSGSPRSSLRHANDGRSSPGRTGTSSPKRVKSLRQHHYHMRAAAIKHHTAAAAAAAHNTGQMSPITGGATESPRLLPPPNAGGSPKQHEAKTLQPVYQSLLAQQQAAAAATLSMSQSQPLPAGTTVVAQISPPPGLVPAAGAAGAAAAAAGANARPVPRTAFAPPSDSQQPAKTPPNASRGLARTATGAGSSFDLNAPSLVQTHAALSSAVAPALQPSTSPQHRSVPEGPTPGHSKNPSLSQSGTGTGIGGVRKVSRDSPQSLSSSNPLAAAAQAAAEELEATHAAAAASARPSSSESRLRAQRTRSHSSSGAGGVHPQDGLPVGVHNVSQSSTSLPAVGQASPPQAPQTQPYLAHSPQPTGDARPPSSHGTASGTGAGAAGATGSPAPGTRPLSGRRAKPANPVATAGAIAAVNNAAASASAASGGISGSHSRKPSVESSNAAAGAGGSVRRSSNSGLGGASSQSTASVPRFASPTASSSRAAVGPAQVQRQPSGSSRSSAASQGFTDALTAATDKQSARGANNSPATVARRNSGSSSTAGAAAAATAAAKGSTNSPPVMPVQAAVLSSPTGPVTAPVVVGGLPSRRPSNTSSPNVVNANAAAAAGGAAGARSSPRLSPPHNAQAAPTAANDTPPKPQVTISTTASATDSPTPPGASSPANAAGGSSLFPPSAKPVRSSPISKMSRRPDGGDGTSSPVHGSRNVSASLFAAAGAASLNGTTVKPQSGGGTGTGFYASSASAFSTANAGAAAAGATGAAAAKGAPLPLGNAAGASLSATGPMSGRNRLPALQK